MQEGSFWRAEGSSGGYFMREDPRRGWSLGGGGVSFPVGLVRMTQEERLWSRGVALGWLFLAFLVGRLGVASGGVCRVGSEAVFFFHGLIFLRVDWAGEWGRASGGGWVLRGGVVWWEVGSFSHGRVAFARRGAFFVVTGLGGFPRFVVSFPFG